MFRPPTKTLAPDAAAPRGLRSASINPGRRFDVREDSVRAQQRGDDLPGRRIERRETPAEKVTPNPLDGSVGYLIDAEFDLEAPPGKLGDHPDCRADAQGDLAGQQQTI